ncbi:MAG: hypothetical protein ACXVAX_06585, partial [Pseudobdellovibrio sp.]
MKNLAVSILAVLLTSTVFAQVEPSADDSSASAAEPALSYQQAPNRHYEFKKRGVDLFEESLGRLHYRLVMTDGKHKEEKDGQVDKEGFSGSIAESLLAEMKHSLNGEPADAEDTKIKFNCVEDYKLAKLPLFKQIFGKPGRCTLTMKSKADGQDQKATVTFDMELVDTPEYKNWPKQIVGPEATLKIEVAPVA